MGRLRAFAVALALAGCSTSSSSSSPPPPPDAAPAVDAPGPALDAPAPPPPVDAGTDAGLPDLNAFCAGTYNSLLLTEETCCSPADRTHGSYQFLDAVLHILLSACQTDLPARVAAGRVRFDPQAAAACITAEQAQLAGHTCSTPLTINLVPECASVFAGQQTDGSPCTQDIDCLDGLTCVGWTAAGGEGACAPSPAVGAACGESPSDGGPPVIPWQFGNHPDCATGGYCKGSPGGKCAAQSTSGGPCASDVECPTGLTCHLRTCGTTGPAGDGGACASGSDCQLLLYCAGAATDAGACTPQKPAGSPCANVFSAECLGQCAVPDGGGATVCATYCGSN
jgi:hypothetical protein